MNILLVDDESYVTESLYQTIPWNELSVREVYQAASALEAIDLLEAHEIDIVVTDVRMPAMTGLELMETLADRWPQVRCILLSGYSDFEYAKQAIRLQASDYILKPVDDGEFIQSVHATVTSIQAEREELGHYYHLLYSRKSDFGILRTTLLRDLVLGQEVAQHYIQTKLNEYEIPLEVNKSALMLLIQLGPRFRGMDDHSLGLMEYAIGNIAEEVLMESFHVWPGKTPHHCMVLLVQRKTTGHEGGRAQAIDRELLQGLVLQFQQEVKNYLRGEIAVYVTSSFRFPSEISAVYRSGLGDLYRWEQEPGHNLRFADDDRVQQRDSSVQAIDLLNRPPSLLHLLETRQWETAHEKLEKAFTAMEAEHIGQASIHEAFLSVTSAFMYIAHKQGYYIHQLDQAGFDPLYIQQVVQSVSKLSNWSFEMLKKLSDIASTQETTSKSHIIKQVQEMVTADSGYDLSVKTIADRVFLHPVYLSKIYKNETGEGLGDYIIRKRMERALYLLKFTNKKIYEITAELGYQNPQYFSKMFRKYYGMTPNEYRDQGCC
ncbi:hypothetical protein JCM10914A_26900 [Paenibacillus sp. JCM 10914]|uniref:response regulator transcription factor n=1 Tax=Paenibacillus sp. JCM 10914 TaxID=1236974 RepID=UPI0003CC4014|nr:response regulator [Paenibacillus sp. JCM 10914]GAE08198.1 hypothetical protein JCM10914_4486 [Paenibacillus sp. JCM 10914]